MYHQNPCLFIVVDVKVDVNPKVLPGLLKRVYRSLFDANNSVRVMNNSYEAIRPIEVKQERKQKK